MTRIGFSRKQRLLYGLFSGYVKFDMDSTSTLINL
jgi:hypothetical protein